MWRLISVHGSIPVSLQSGKSGVMTSAFPGSVVEKWCAACWSGERISVKDGRLSRRFHVKHASLRSSDGESVPAGNQFDWIPWRQAGAHGAIARVTMENDGCERWEPRSIF